MGIIASKPADTYVLRIQEDQAKLAVSIKPSPAQHQTTTTNNNTTSVAPSSSSTKHGGGGGQPLHRNASSHAVVMITTGAPDIGKPIDSPSRQPSSRLQKQSSELQPSSKLQSKKDPSAKNLTRQTTQPLVAQASFVAGSPVAAATKHIGVQCSNEFPWLIRQGNLSMMQLQDFEAGRIIGRGLMGTVRITKMKASEKFFVLKSIRKDYIQRHNDLRHIQNEKQALYTLQQHPFIVNVFGTFQDRLNVYFALQFVPGGELYRRLTKAKRFSPDATKFYVTEVCSALAYVQRQGFVYRDLKPENVLIDEEGHCKLVDFGFAIRCSASSSADNNAEDKMHTLCGTPAYLSPEQLDGKLTNGYTRVVDWWSFGVLIYELLTGKTPFCKHNSESHYEIFLRILNHKISFPLSFDGAAKEIISQLCHANLQKRLTDTELILQHRYFVIPWTNVDARQLVPPYVPRLPTSTSSVKEGKEVKDQVARYFEMYHDPQHTPNNSTEHDKDASKAVGNSGSSSSGAYEYLDF